ncbi:hypothetical protein ABPG72_021564 [Tetrahymena utriculariae]
MESIMFDNLGSMKCRFHKDESVTYLCMDLNCQEQTRLLCGDCAIFISHHKDHIHNIVKIKNIQNSADGSSLNLVKNAILQSSTCSFMPDSQDIENREFMSVNQVNLYFDLIERQVVEEIQRVRKRVISLVNMQDTVLFEINQQISKLEAQIAKSFECPKNKKNNKDNSLSSSSFCEEDFLDEPQQDSQTRIKCSSLFNMVSDSQLNSWSSQDQNSSILINVTSNNNQNLTQNKTPQNLINTSNQQNNCLNIFEKQQQELEAVSSQQSISSDTQNECEISREITSSLNKILEYSSEQIIELEMLMKQQLKHCKINLNQFSHNLNTFLSSYLPRQQLLEFNSINAMLDNRFGFELSNGELQILDPAEFYLGMGIKHCIGINSTSNLSLLRRASTLICHQSPDDEDDIQKGNMSEPQNQNQIETQRQYLFSVFFDNKSLNDFNIEPISQEIQRLSYIQNIHLDFDGNFISPQGYKHIFNALKQFECLKHIDLRFNCNQEFDEESIMLLSDVLKAQKSNLRTLCITMRSLCKKTSSVVVNFNSASCPNSPHHQSLHSSSSTSFSSSSTQFHPAQHPELKKCNTNICQQDKFSFSDVLRILFEAIGQLTNLEVLYLDVSHNNISQISGQEVFAPIHQLKKLNMIYFVFNKTNIPYQEVVQFIHSINANKKSLKYFKLFLKQNCFNFQQERYICGQFQKIKAQTKNLDLFY